MDEEFCPAFSSARNTGIYEVLDLQGWTNGAPQADKTAAQFLDLWTAAESDSLLSICT
jgi:hypothetical protein